MGDGVGVRLRSINRNRQPLTPRWPAPSSPRPHPARCASPSRPSGDFPFIVAAPQLAAGEVWSTSHVLPVLDALLNQPLPLDRSRVTLTGLSMGGDATWQTGLAAPERFAALVPIASKGELDQPCRLSGVPIWVYHNEGDKLYPVAGAQSAVKQLADCGHPVRLTVYPRNGHNAWSAAYASPELFEWLLGQSLQSRPRAVGK